MRRQPTHAILFGLVVAICLLQVSWWIVFQFREAARLEAAARHLTAGDTHAAARELGAEQPADLAETARRRRTMFAAEGAVLGLLGLIGVVFFYLALQRERRLRLLQERFLTGATHELKTPLTTLRIGVESLADDRVPDAQQARYLDAMLCELDRLDGGLTNLLAAGGLALAERDTRRAGDLADDLRAAVDHFRARYAAKGVALVAGHAHTGFPACPVVRDAGAIRIVLHNLLDNALKFTEPGGHVEIALARDDAARLVRLSVRDDGLGIDARDLPHLFERFYRGTDKAHIGGTGIGLALVAELVAAHGGRVHAHSEGAGRGSTFTVELPSGDARGGPS